MFLDKEKLEPIGIHLFDSSSRFWKGILNIYYPTRFRALRAIT